MEEEELKRLREDRSFNKSSLYFSLYLYMLGDKVQEFLAKRSKITSIFSDTEVPEIVEISNKYKCNFIYILSDISVQDEATNAAIDLWRILRDLNVKCFHHFLPQISKTIFAIQIDWNIKQSFKEGRYSKMYPPVTVDLHFNDENSSILYKRDIRNHGKQIARRKKFSRKALRLILNNEEDFRKSIGYTSDQGEADSPPILRNETFSI